MKTKLIVFITFLSIAMIISCRKDNSKPDPDRYTTLHKFTGMPDGNGSNSSLISAGSFLYGMTPSGGTSNQGTLFKITPDGTGYSRILNFSNDTVHGYSPNGSLFSDGIFLYGMTDKGGINDKGTIFKIMPDGTSYLKLHDFDDTLGAGCIPIGTLISDGTFLYGMTSYDWFGFGYIFKIKPDGTGFAKLFNFGSSVGAFQPRGSLLLNGTFLYGTIAGGGANASGGVFKIKPDGTGFAILHSFSGNPNEARPGGPLVSDGNYLYGITSGNISSNGILFKIKFDGTGYAIFSDLSAPGGYDPWNGNSGSLIFDGTFLYGMRSHVGGPEGSIFKVRPDGTGFPPYTVFLNSVGIFPPVL